MPEVKAGGIEIVVSAGVTVLLMGAAAGGEILCFGCNEHWGCGHLTPMREAAE